MFYKPKFCCHCGEKIERADWRLWTSRRFCEFCETEFKGEQLFKSAAAAACVLIGALGMAGLFRQQPVAQTEASSALPTYSKPAAFTPTGPISAETRNSNGRSAPAASDESMAESSAAESYPIPGGSKTSEQPTRAKKSSDKPAYFCGATTKKGTPCSRRVRTKGIRCWQHDDES